MPTLEQHAAAHGWTLTTVKRVKTDETVERWSRPDTNEVFSDIERLLDSRIGWPLEGPCKDAREVYIRLRAARATISSTFGNAGEQGYTAYYRLPDGQRVTVSNGPWNLATPDWQIAKCTY